MIEQAVILAAGTGLRLGRDLPKGLTLVAGRPVLSWIIEALENVGVKTVHAIVGASSDHFAPLVNAFRGRVEVRTAFCPDAALGNGMSAAFAERVITQPRFFLLMSDHLISSRHLSLVAAAPADTCALGTSSPMPWIDLDDATKVVTDGTGLIRQIGKELTQFDAVDTGVFAMTRALFPALARARERGEYSLTGGNRLLAREGMLRAASIGDLRWCDIDTPADLAAAEAWLGTGPP